jgi:polar amino acid transport system substrate-binding protein
VKKNINWFFSLLVCGSLLCGCVEKKNSGQDSLMKIKKKGVIVVGLDDQFPPMGFRNKSGEIVGFDIDLARVAAKKLGVKVEFKPVAWDGIVFSLKNGDVDLIWNGLTITPGRKKAIAMTNSYLADKQIIMVKSNSNIQNLTDLKGCVVGIQLGSSSANALKKNKILVNSLKKVRLYDNNTQALMDLAAGRINSVVIDEVVGRYYIKKRPGDYRVLRRSLKSENFGIGLCKGDKKLLTRLNEIMTQIRKEGIESRISKKWFGVDLAKSEEL